MRKFAVEPSIMHSASFLPCRCVARNPNAFPVGRTVRLTFNHGWFPDKQFAPHMSPVSGREMLDMLAGWRSGYLAL